MRTTIDKAGRIVVPKQLRDEVGLVPGAEVEITVAGSAVRIEPIPGAEPALEERGGRLVVAPSAAILSAEDVDAIRDALRR